MALVVVATLTAALTAAVTVAPEAPLVIVILCQSKRRAIE
jgi:hypothetical protein